MHSLLYLRTCNSHHTYTRLHWSAGCCDSGESYYVTEVNGDAVVALGLHRYPLLQVFSDRSKKLAEKLSCFLKNRRSAGSRK